MVWLFCGFIGGFGWAPQNSRMGPWFLKNSSICPALGSPLGGLDCPVIGCTVRYPGCEQNDIKSMFAAIAKPGSPVKTIGNRSVSDPEK